MAAPTEKTNVVTAIVYDFETGGLDCTKCAATQISLHAVRLDTFEVMETFNSYILPYDKKEIGKPKRKVLKNKYDTEQSERMEYQDNALAYSGITMELLHSQGRPLDDVCADICEFIRRNTFKVSPSNKPILVGQNPLFDKGFMQQIMLYAGRWEEFCKLVRGSKDFWGNFQPTHLDTIVLAQLTFDHDKSVTNWRLESIAERLGIDLDDAHDADADVTATREIVRVLTARMRENGGAGLAIGSITASENNKKKLRDHFKI